MSRLLCLLGRHSWRVSIALPAILVCARHCGAVRRAA